MEILRPVLGASYHSPINPVSAELVGNKITYIYAGKTSYGLSIDGILTITPNR